MTAEELLMQTLDVYDSDIIEMMNKFAKLMCEEQKKLCAWDERFDTEDAEVILATKFPKELINNKMTTTLLDTEYHMLLELYDPQKFVRKLVKIKNIKFKFKAHAESIDIWVLDSELSKSSMEFYGFRDYLTLLNAG